MYLVVSNLIEFESLGCDSDRDKWVTSGV